MISKTNDELTAANDRKKVLGAPSGNGVVDFRKIQDLVNRIKTLKGTYCQQYDKYDKKAHSLWKVVQKFEA